MATELARIAAVLKRTMDSLHGSVDDLARELVRVLGVNQTDRRALELILFAGETVTTPGLLAERLGLTAAGTTIVLNRLEKLGYIRRSLHPTDHRRVTVLATDLAASRLSELVSPLLDQAGKMLSRHYSAAEIDLIVGFLARTDEIQQAHLKRMRELEPYPH
ncbi:MULTISPECIES: MarR family transcriptional regulator [unclassified Mycobacterium]|uniref:MarR family winged helix-turn-helix transcriptional regulator n=1 Tax=unclassified Mycobacterium TaxID=2642494 RepID=UPI00056D1CC4|nr:MULTISPECIES: MarR family transcriptional regulator [unclassified Mycobacterium]SEA92210.1 MarR family protein [Mycobacterium sp. 283mftsu]